MKVSILVPVYGVEKYIEECAVSLFEQTYDDIEYIFVDDCSPDHSIQVLEQVLSRYPHRRSQVSIIHHQTNRGLGASRSTGLAAATGDYVMYVDSDDLIATDTVEKLCRRQQETDADIVDCGFRRLLPDGTLGEATLPSKESTDLLLRMILVQNTVSHNIWGRLIRRNLHTQYDIDFPEGVNMAEDYCSISRLIFVARSRTFIGEALYLYRVNESGTFMSWATERHMHSYLKAIHVVGAFLDEHDKTHAYSYSYELGMLNARYHALGVLDEKKIEAICPYRPSHRLFRWCRVLLCHRFTRPLLRMTYLVVKRLYLKKLLS